MFVAELAVGFVMDAVETVCGVGRAPRRSRR